MLWSELHEWPLKPLTRVGFEGTHICNRSTGVIRGTAYGLRAPLRFIRQAAVIKDVAKIRTRSCFLPRAWQASAGMQHLMRMLWML
jgi:hypothetical protein